MIADEIKARLSPEVKADLHIFDCLPSTNTTLRGMAEAGAPSGTAVIARRQTAGRGRLGRSFASPADAGLYISILLREDVPVAQLPLLTPYAAVAAARATESVADVRVGIKWVNDLRIGEKKIAGILTEGGFSPSGGLAYAIIGVGINLLPSALPPELADIAAAIGDYTAPPTVGEMAAALLNRFFLDLPSFRDASFLEEYRRRSVVIGRTVTATDGERTLVGLAEAIEDDGALRLVDEGGTVHLLRAGEVSIRL